MSISMNAMMDVNICYVLPFIFLYMLRLFFLTEWEACISELLLEDTDTDTDTDEDPPALVPVVMKYEDKYVEDIRKLSKDWVFSEEDKWVQSQKYMEVLSDLVQSLQSQLDYYKRQIEALEKESAEDIDTIDTKPITVWNEENNVYEEVAEDSSLEERNAFRQAQMESFKEEIETIERALANAEKSATDQAKDHVIQQKLDKLGHNFVMEKTPLGNVLMLYDKDRETFKYYADSAIPYRYLETVGRKYVKLFNCRPLFVDMEEELQLVEEKWTKEYELKKAKEKEIEENKRLLKEKEKKSVFAKFKNYNKQVGKIGAPIPPKTHLVNVQAYSKENEKILLKVRANRYTYEGKLANFNFLQKVEKKMFNKRLNLTFSEFKKWQEQQKQQTQKQQA